MRLTLTENQRFLAWDDGRPFFWLADTAWELLHRLSLEEARLYLRTRAQQGFTVIQTVLLAEFDGLHVPNFYGRRPLHGDDPTQPDEEYFRFVDQVLEEAEKAGLVLALLPTWGDKVNRNQWGVGPVVFDERNARQYGEWLGRRWRDRANLVWVLGGDRPAEHEGAEYRPLWRAMAAGLDAGEGRRRLKTYHPSGGHSSSAWVHAEDWLDLNMMQSGHGDGRDTPVWTMVEADRARTPTKPVLDGEPNYEDHPVIPWPKWDPANGHYDDYDVRKQCWRSVLAGACGVTYGHHSIWQFCGRRHEAISHALMDWQSALVRPGALQVQWLRRLVESRPFAQGVPDQSLFCGDEGSGGAHKRALRDAAGRWAMAYLPGPAPVRIDLGILRASGVTAWWYDPRQGSALRIGEFPASGIRVFVPPLPGPDWALVLDDPAAGFPPPGAAGN